MGVSTHVAERAEPAPPRGRLSRQLIVSAAVRLLDERGTEAFSMRVLAESLDASPMALYRHVESRADLEIAVARAVAPELDLEDDPSQPPEEAIADWMRQLRAHWLRHPWFGHLVGLHAELGEYMVGIGTRLSRALRRAGADDHLAAREVVRITRTTLGVVLIEQASPLGQYERRIADATDARPPDEVADRVELLRDYDDDDFFEDLIYTTVLGFQARLERSRRGGDIHVHH
jgi:AcrR family transcriptional regulator